jgi:hypothetical protein
MATFGIDLDLCGNVLIYMFESKKISKDKLLSSFKISVDSIARREDGSMKDSSPVEFSVEHEEFSEESRVLVGSLLLSAPSESSDPTKIQSDSSSSMEMIEHDELSGSESETIEEEDETLCSEPIRAIDVNELEETIVPEPEKVELSEQIGEMESRISASLEDMNAINRNSQLSNQVAKKIKNKVPKFLRKKVSKDGGMDEEKDVVAQFNNDNDEPVVHVKEIVRSKSNYNFNMLIKLESISIIDDSGSNPSNLTLRVTNGENKTAPSQKIKLKDNFCQIEKEIRMNIYNFDGDDLNFDIYNGKENYASGFLKLSEITGDKYHTRNLTLESNPSALASMVQGNSAKRPVAKLKFILSKTGQQKTQEQKKVALDSFKKSGKVNLTILCAHKLKIRQGAIAAIKFGNERLETKPAAEAGEVAMWGDQFIFDIEDSFDLIEISLYSSTSKKEFLGQISLSLHVDLTAKRSYHFYLKDQKGKRVGNASIEFKIDFRFSKVMAGLKMFQPRGSLHWVEKKEDVSLTRIAHLINRIKSFIITPDFDAMMKQVEDILYWRKPFISFCSLIGWLLFVNLFQLWMVPFGLAIGIIAAKFSKDKEEISKKEKKEEKSPSAAKDFKLIAQSKDALRSTQDTLEMIASNLERLRNTFKWKIPFSCYVLSTAVIVISIVLFFIPIRILLSLWGINKICRRLVQPGFVNNNEILDFLSRQPSDPQYKRMKNEPVETAA